MKLNQGIVGRVAWPAAAVLLSLAMLSGCSRPYTSEVVSTGENAITIADSKDKTQRTHEVAPDARITLDGKPARLEDLDSGDAVKMTVVRTAAKEMATGVDARSKESADAGTPTSEPPDDADRPAEPAEQQALPGDYVPLPTPLPKPLPIPDRPGADVDRQLSPEANAPEPLDEAAEEAVAGIISKIHVMDNHFVVGDEAGVEYNFMVDSDTKFTLDGNEATFSDLAMGHMVNVTSVKDGNVFFARTVDASSK